MRLLKFRHKGLRQLYSDGDPKAIPASQADKLRKLLFTLETAQDIEQVGRFPGWRLHPLKGDLKGFWGLTPETGVSFSVMMKPPIPQPILI